MSEPRDRDAGPPERIGVRRLRGVAELTSLAEVRAAAKDYVARVLDEGAGRAHEDHRVPAAGEDEVREPVAVPARFDALPLKVG